MTDTPPMDLSRLCVPPDATLREAIRCIDQNQRGIALVVDDARQLVGTVTDGDARRAMLAGRSLDVPVVELLAEKAKSSPYPRPVTASTGTDSAVLLQMMQDLVIRQIP